MIVKMKIKNLNILKLQFADCVDGLLNEFGKLFDRLTNLDELDDDEEHKITCSNCEDELDDSGGGDDVDLLL